MKRILLAMIHRILVLMVLITLFAFPSGATNYYLATSTDGGSDSNSGTDAAHPWVSPNHALNCGDVIIAKSSTAYTGFVNNFGTVTCSGGNNVAWLKCESFGTCKITANGGDGFRVNKSYWGITGWEATVASGNYSCFSAVPPDANVLHHIIFANNVANGCYANGITTYNLNGGSVDYIAIVGNIIHDAAKGANLCFSGISIYQPIAYDSLPGTHIYIAGNFSSNNVDPNPCYGVAPLDGEGILLDTIDGSQGGLALSYDKQIVVENNMSLYNGGRGIEVFNNEDQRGGTGTAPIYIRQNTVWNSARDTNANASYCGQIMIHNTKTTYISRNLLMAPTQYGCGSWPVYAAYVGFVDYTSTIDDNWMYSPWGYNEGRNNYDAFVFGTNLKGTDPAFTNPTDPGAPVCTGKTSVPDCMSTVITNYTAQAVGASSYGYQPVRGQTYNPYFPLWLCNVNLPTGLITMGCVGTSVQGLTITGGTLK